MESNDWKIKNDFYSLSEICGYCKYIEHRGFLTLKQVLAHKCLNKGCTHFLPQEGPLYNVLLKMKDAEELEKQIKTLSLLESEKDSLKEMKASLEEIQSQIQIELEKCAAIKAERDEKRSYIYNLMQDTSRADLERSVEIKKLLSELQEESVKRPVWNKDRKGRVKKNKHKYKENRTSRKKKYSDKQRSENALKMTFYE